MEKLIEAYWHSRGEQGAVTVSKSLATSALAEVNIYRPFLNIVPKGWGHLSNFYSNK